MARIIGYIILWASSFFITVTKSVLMADLHSLFLVAAYGESVEPKLGRCISLLKLLTSH